MPVVPALEMQRQKNWGKSEASLVDYRSARATQNAVSKKKDTDNSSAFVFFDLSCCFLGLLIFVIGT